MVTPHTLGSEILHLFIRKMVNVCRKEDHEILLLCTEIKQSFKATYTILLTALLVSRRLIFFHYYQNCTDNRSIPPLLCIGDAH